MIAITLILFYCAAFLGGKALIGDTFAVGWMCAIVASAVGQGVINSAADDSEDDEQQE